MSKDDLMDGPSSPYIDVEALSDEDQSTQSQRLCSGANPDILNIINNKTDDQRVLTLAEQFLAAMPARIKHDSQSQESEIMQWDECSCDASQSDDLGIESMGDDFDFDFSVVEETYARYRDNAYTPSSVSPVSSCLHSPRSNTIESPSPSCQSRSFSQNNGGAENNGISPPCTTADLQEFLQASIKCERDLSNLTLSDQEQRELYEAAQIIQKAYRSYKGRKNKSQGQDREAKAAIVIQNYYRRYKQVNLYFFTYIISRDACEQPSLNQLKQYVLYCCAILVTL